MNLFNLLNDRSNELIIKFLLDTETLRCESINLP